MMFRSRKRRLTASENGRDDSGVPVMSSHAVSLGLPVTVTIETEEGKQYLKKLYVRFRKILWTLAMLLVLARGVILFVSNAVSVPTLGPLPSQPRKASATLYTEANTCYDIALQALLLGWTRTASKHPMLVLHSIPLPEKVASFMEAHPDKMRAVPVAERSSSIVENPRWRKCATKFAIWDQTEYDLLAYYDVDHLFSNNFNDDVFDIVHQTNSTNTQTMDAAGRHSSSPLLYGVMDSNRRKQFNGGHLLIRPSRAIYEKLNYLYDWRLVFMWMLGGSLQDAFMSGDQRYLNIVLRGRWVAVDRPQHAKHAKVWKVATYPLYNGTARQRDARYLIDELGLRSELKTCIRMTASSVSSNDRPSLSYWFDE